MPALFRQVPDLELVERFLQSSLGLRSIQDQAWFTKQSIRIQESELLFPELEPYYMPCKAKDFLHSSLTQNRILTILRQLVRAHGFEIYAKERSNGGKKGLWYCIQSNKDTSSQEVEVTFD